MLYFDNFATTPLDPRVRSVMIEALDRVGNAASSEHSFGWDAAGRVELARGQIATLIGADPEEIVFTSGATEANNIAVLGGARAAPPERRRIIISAIEHKSVIEAAEAAEQFGFTVERVGVGPNGLVDPAQLNAMVDDRVAVVSIMAVNNEIGAIQAVEELGRVVRAAGAFFHVDATQAPAAMEIEARSWQADALSLSSHKIYGPGGVGALFIAHDTPWRPSRLMFGGGQEAALRPGTVPTALCAGFGEAARIMLEEGSSERRRVGRLRDRFAERLTMLWPATIITAAGAPRHPGCLHVRLPGIDASDLLMRLQPAFAASTGSACSSGILGPSYVVRAIGYSAAEADECLRLSFGRFTTDEEIDEGLERLSGSISSCSHGSVAA